MSLDLHLEAMIDAQLRLEGEAIIRVSTGLPVPHKPAGANPYAMVWLKVGPRKGRLVFYHKAKFYLFFGWMPELVDHRDRVKLHNYLANLRPATRTTNGFNRRTKRKSGLPRGVLKRGLRWTARGDGYLGTFGTIEEASAAVEAFYREKHGEFYTP